MAQHLGASKCHCISKESFWRFPVFQALPSVSSKSNTSSRSSRICITPKSWLSRRFYAKTYRGRYSILIKKYNNVSQFFRRQTKSLSAWNQTNYHHIANPFLSIGHSIFPIHLFGNIASCLGVLSGCFMPKKMRQKNTPSSF